jgi:Flp pilus assembly protein TadG
MKERILFNLLREEKGASLVELALVFPLFVLLLLGCVDFGRAYYLAIEVAGAAHAAVMYGSRNPSDTAGMTSAAQDDAPNVPNLSVQTPTYGCECADGSSYSANCASTPSSCPNSIGVVYLVNVTVTGTYAPLLKLPAISNSMTFTSTASMRSAGS